MKQQLAQGKFHEGELVAQARAGVSDKAMKVARVIQDHIPQRVWSFITAQTLVVVGSIDENGNMWASIIYGEPGFVFTKNGRTLHLQHHRSYPMANDPLWQNLSLDAKIGILLIDFETRNRLRINGRVVAISEESWVVSVEQCYGNCQKYITRRSLSVCAPAQTQQATQPEQGNELDSAAQQLITQADTFFVASAHPDHGVDVSHRGGYPGFIKVLSTRLLRIPDFVGNNLFNTLGNFTSYPHAGLTFIDFARNKILQLTGKPVIRWDEHDNSGLAGVTARAWDFHINRCQMRVVNARVIWRFLEDSPYNMP